MEFKWLIVFLCIFGLTLTGGCSIPCQGVSETNANNTTNDTVSEHPKVPISDVVVR